MANYPSIDSELLRTFVAIADHGGFTRAAEVVNRTQSAVSMQMKRLEEDVLERPLFQRDGRQVSLTAEGQVLLGYARRILKLHGEVMTTLREPHMVGAVRIGTPDDYVMRFMPGILSRFAQAYPLVQVELHCEPSFSLLQRQDLDLVELVRELVLRLTPIADMKDVELVICGDSQVDISADPILLQNAIRNLIDNALKYSPGDSVVEIHVRSFPMPHLEIHDQGPGFPPDEIANLADRFSRGHNAEGTIGSGLGLTIAQDVAKAHGGAMTLSNLPTGGACVTFSV